MKAIDNILECVKCTRSFSEQELEQNMMVCKGCGYHFRLPAKRRLEYTVDEGTLTEFEGAAIGSDPLSFPEYKDKLFKTRNELNITEAVITATGEIDGHKCVICAMDGRFLMGSMGMAVGEKITRAFELATQKRMPVIIFSVSGGARMQEGIVSLMQMAKTAGAVKKHSDAGLLYISVLTDPTTGGVLASFAGLGDIILAEPKAYIGFAGKRVIENTLGQTLPKGFQTSEFMVQKGFVDKIVHRKDMKDIISALLDIHKGGTEL